MMRWYKAAIIVSIATITTLVICDHVIIHYYLLQYAHSVANTLPKSAIKCHVLLCMECPHLGSAFYCNGLFGLTVPLAINQTKYKNYIAWDLEFRLGI